jgi:hypothetical protein
VAAEPSVSRCKNNIDSFQRPYGSLREPF